MAGRKRIPAELSRERERVAWELRQQLWTEPRIADHLGVTKQAVSAMLKRVSVRVLAELKENVELVKADQTAQLQWIASEATTAWHHSKQDAQTVKTVVGPQGEDDGLGTATIKEETTVKGQAGDPALLSQARGALADIRSIWGLDAPEKVEVQSEVKLYAFDPDGPDGP